MEDSSLEELKSRLYSKKTSVEERNKEIRFRAQENSTETKNYWASNAGKAEEIVNKTEVKKRPMPVAAKKAIYISLASILLVATLAAFYFWFKSSGGLTEGKSAEVRVGGPVSVAAGEPFSAYIEIKNKGGINIEAADLVLEYPVGMRLRNNQNVELARDRKTLGKINAGEAVNQILEMVAFGEGGSDKTIKATVEYRLENSNATLVNEGVYTFKLSQSPIDIALNFPIEVKTRQEIDFEVEVRSNASTLIKDLYLQIEYPPGFQFTKSKPEPLKNNLWKLGDLTQGVVKKIVLTGLIEGQEMEEKFFNIKVGTLSQDKMSNVYGSTGKGIVLRKPAFGFTVLINGADLEKNIVSSGEKIRGEIIWENNLPVSVQDSSVSLKINGAAVDSVSLFAENGFYRASESALVWTKTTEPALRSISSGQSHSLKFSFSIKKPLPVLAPGDKNFVVSIDAIMSGRKVEPSGENIEVRSDVQKRLLVNSGLQLAARGVHYSGPFTNSGPLPPKVGQETTYTVIWSLINPSNDILDVKISAPLPAYMRWLGAVAPVGAPITFDENTGLVTWNKGVVKAGTGVLSQAEEAAFQIGLTPAPNQVGTSPDILLESILTGTDSFTGATVNISKPGMDTLLRDDPKFDNNQGIVKP